MNKVYQMLGRAGVGRILVACLLFHAVAAEALEALSQESSLSFPVGEELHYDIYWGFLHVGSSRVTTAWIEEDGRRLLRIRARTKSNKVLSVLYPVDDIIESVVVPETMLPVRFEKNLKEGGYRCHEITEFDHEAGEARWRSELSEDAKTYEIEADTRDLISFMYAARETRFAPGEKKNFSVMADEKIYELLVKVHSAEGIKVDGQKVNSIRLEPKAAFEGLFVHKGDMMLWVAMEDPKVITRMEIEIPVASVHLRLEKIKGNNAGWWARR